MPRSQAKKTIPNATKKQGLKQVRTFSLVLNEEELVHVRDMLGVILPPDGTTRLSESLASSEGRQLSETLLWGKVVSLCEQAGVPVGDQAPDFFVGMTGPLQLAVFQLENGVKSKAEEDEGK